MKKLRKFELTPKIIFGYFQELQIKIPANTASLKISWRFLLRVFFNDVMFMKKSGIWGGKLKNSTKSSQNEKNMMNIPIKHVMSITITLKI